VSVRARLQLSDWETAKHVTNSMRYTCKSQRAGGRREVDHDGLQNGRGVQEQTPGRLITTVIIRGELIQTKRETSNRSDVPVRRKVRGGRLLTKIRWGS
jgi:hypothetical protein